MLLNYGARETLESLLDSKEIKPINPKGNQTWISIGKTDAEAEAPVLWPTDGERWLISKDLDTEKDLGLEDKGMIEEETAPLSQWTCVWASSRRWWRGNLASCRPWCQKQSKLSNWTTEAWCCGLIYFWCLGSRSEENSIEIVSAAGFIGNMLLKVYSAYNTNMHDTQKETVV